MSDQVNQLSRYADALEVLHRPSPVGTDPIRPQRDGPRPLVLMTAIGLVGGVLILVSVLASKPSQTATTVEPPEPSPSDLADTTSELTDSAAPTLEDLIPEGSVAVSLNYPTEPDTALDLEAGDRVRISGIGPEGTSEVTATVLDVAADSETLVVVVPAVDAYLLAGDIHLPALRVEPVEDE